MLINGSRRTGERLASMVNRLRSLKRTYPVIFTSSGIAWHRAATTLRQYVASRFPKATAGCDRWAYQRLQIGSRKWYHALSAADSGAAVSCGFLWLSAREIGERSSERRSAAMLAT